MELGSLYSYQPPRPSKPDSYAPATLPPYANASSPELEKLNVAGACHIDPQKFLPNKDELEPVFDIEVVEFLWTTEVHSTSIHLHFFLHRPLPLSRHLLRDCCGHVALLPVQHLHRTLPALLSVLSCNRMSHRQVLPCLSPFSDPSPLLPSAPYFSPHQRLSSAWAIWPKSADWEHAEAECDDEDEATPSHRAPFLSLHPPSNLFSSSRRRTYTLSFTPSCHPIISRPSLRAHCPASSPTNPTPPAPFLFTKSRRYHFWLQTVLLQQDPFFTTSTSCTTCAKPPIANTTKKSRALFCPDHLRSLTPSSSSTNARSHSVSPSSPRSSRDGHYIVSSLTPRSLSKIRHAPRRIERNAGTRRRSGS
ncbi:hypothetical protein BLNAU_2286 [Blattamonas nauphoetae]|uniref:Uncharacterized protein n=1 Tax=Blattamonas nauphoetae TaxID=2049346 RepID=A0ABQ9YGF4_9EUKA|nr:hypothetical protein BLNAU_2286 [Blattamonas nauphoetae]